MSEKVLRFFVDELTTIRVLCKNDKCQGVVEYPVERAKVKFQNCNQCPLCQEDFPGPGNASPIYELAKAIEMVQSMGGRKLRVEFVLPGHENGITES